MTATNNRDYSEQIVASALLKAFSGEISPESRIMLGRYSKQVAFQNQDYRLVQLAFYMNLSPEAVENPNLVMETAEMMGADCDSLLDIHVVTEELYHAIVYLTGSIFDLGEIVERVATRAGD